MIFRSDIMSAIAESISVMIVDLATEEILYASRALESLFGYGIHGELAGKNFTDLIPPAHRDVHRQHVLDFSSTMLPVVVGGNGVPGLRSDGSEIRLCIVLSGVVLDKRRCAVAVIGPFHERVHGPIAADRIAKDIQEKT